MASKRIDKKKLMNAAGLPTTKKTNKARADAAAMDYFRNAPARMGYNTPSLAEGTEYNLVRLSNNYWLMVTLFCNHWLCRRIVEQFAQDMCKAWPRLKCKVTPEQISQFDRTIARTQTPLAIQKTIKWARLFGGAGALMVIDGHEEILDKPLDLETISLGSYKGLIVFDRWSGITPDTEIEDDLSRPIDFGLPKYYSITGEDGAFQRVHCSRILRFTGPDVPQPEFGARAMWGISVLEVVFESIRKMDNASWSILQLLFRAQVLSQVNPQLASLLSGAGGSALALQKFQQVMQAQNELLSNNSMLLMGEGSSLEAHQYSFGGIGEVYAQFQMDVAGAAESTVTRLFGRTITGLGQSNDQDERMYEQRIQRSQHETMKPQLDNKLYPVVCMSEFGEVPEDLDIEFPSVRTLTEEEKAKLAKDGVEAILAPFNAGIDQYGSQTVLREVAALSERTEIGTNITPAMIKKAKNDDSAMMVEGDDLSEENIVKPRGKKGAVGKDSASHSDITIQGLPIYIETRAGETRRGDDYEITLPADYGYIHKTVGNDGEEMDCYIGPNIHSPMVYIVEQNHIGTNDFDEHKCMIGFDNEADALVTFFKGHHKAAEVFRSIKPMPMSEFKEWMTRDGFLQAMEMLNSNGDTWSKQVYDRLKSWFK